MGRRLQAGTTFAEIVRAGDPDLAQLLLVRIAELCAEQRGVDLDLARLAPALRWSQWRPDAIPTWCCWGSAADSPSRWRGLRQGSLDPTRSGRTRPLLRRGTRPCNSPLPTGLSRCPRQRPWSARPRRSTAVSADRRLRVSD